MTPWTTRHLNEVFALNPTAERLAMWIALQHEGDLPQLVAVTVSETPKTTARYEL